MGLRTLSVGIDRSPSAEDALRWAAGLASATGSVIRAVSTWQMPFIAIVPGPVEGLPTVEVMQAQCQEMLSRAVLNADVQAEVEQVVLEGSPGPTLVAEAATSDLLVVGRTGHGKRRGISRLAEITLGSTARHCVHHAQTPVVTVPADTRWTDPARVVVGIDGSSSSFAALAWALENLPLSTELRVVRAFAPWVGDGLFPFDLMDNEEVHDSIRRETQSWVDTIVERSNQLVESDPVVDVVIGHARDVLSDPSYGGEPHSRIDMIVVGERGRTGVAAMVLGSISDHLVRYADCPVVVVPDRRHERATT